MLSILDSIILGFVQGMTEFLPISSSGHLIIVRDLLGISQEGGLTFDAILQLATACAVILYFRKDIFDLIRNLFSKTKDTTKNNLTVCLVIGTIPAILFGLVLQDYMDTVFRNISLVALMLVIGAVIMCVADIFIVRRKQQNTENSDLTISKSIIIGLFQTLALIPGMSRSGMSISGGYFVGLSKEMAIRFSFLLSIPIIVGSGLVKLIEIIKEPSLVFGGSGVMIAGFISAFLFGLIAIDFLLKFLKTNSFKVFVFYRIVLVIVIVCCFFS